MTESLRESWLNGEPCPDHTPGPDGSPVRRTDPPRWAAILAVVLVLILVALAAREASTVLMRRVKALPARPGEGAVPRSAAPLPAHWADGMRAHVRGIDAQLRGMPTI